MSKKSLTHRCRVYIPSEDTYYYVIVRYEWYNDGIGSYEFWGTPGYDRGVDCVSIKSMEIQFNADDDQETQDRVTKYVRDSECNWTDECIKQIMHATEE